MKEDLRIVKTKGSIKKVMRELLQTKPIKKITVTELAEKAMINKGTFYLHYPDIYALYDELIAEFIEESFGAYDYYDRFFTNPKEFAEKFVADFQKNEFKKAFPYFEPIREKVPLAYIINEEILKQILNTNHLPNTKENRMRILCCVSAITAGVFHFEETDINTVIEIVSEMINKIVIDEIKSL